MEATKKEKCANREFQTEKVWRRKMSQSVAFMQAKDWLVNAQVMDGIVHTTFLRNVNYPIIRVFVAKS